MSELGSCDVPAPFFSTMSASQAKQTRRAIRRAMGPEALDMVGAQAKAIAQIQQTLELQANRLTALGAEQQLQGERVKPLKVAQKQLKDITVLVVVMWPTVLALLSCVIWLLIRYG